MAGPGSPRSAAPRGPLHAAWHQPKPSRPQRQTRAALAGRSKQLQRPGSPLLHQSQAGARSDSQSRVLCPLLLLTALGWSGGHSLGDGTQQCPSPGSPARDCPPSSRHQTGTSGTQPSIQPAPQTRVPPEAGKANPRRSPRPASRGLCFASRACRHSRNTAATKPTRSSGTKIPLRGLSRVNAPSAPASVPSRQAGKT